MIEDLLCSVCSVTRLQNISDYDFSASDEGEVIEEWVTVETSIKCRIDRFMTSSQRRTDGFINTGRRIMFLLPTVDIKDGDRVYCEGWTYEVNGVMPVYDMRALHHLEVTLSVIDWNNS